MGEYWMGKVVQVGGVIARLLKSKATCEMLFNN